ncbi:glycosyltransferase 87 family protein [Streptomyces sp. NC-S4]
MSGAESTGRLGRPGSTFAIAAVIVVAAIALRLSLLREQSIDYVLFLKPWYQHIADNGGFRALKDTGFSDYNAPYLYFLALLTYLPISPLAGIKAISTGFDLLLAFFAFRITALRHPGRPALPLAAGGVVLFLPTVTANSGWWGQADSIFTAFIVGGIYFVLRHRPWWACTFFGLALAFKLQAVFVFPFLFVLLLVRRLPLKALLAFPAVFLALDVPALLIGADPVKLLTIYARQTGTYQHLTMNAPSVYQFLTVGGHDDAIRSAGILGTGLVLLVLTALVVFSRVGRTSLRFGGRDSEITSTHIVLMATVSAMLVPFLLPSMHERYFYVGDVLSVIAAFYLPKRLWPLPVLVQIASFGSYMQYITDQKLNAMPNMAIYTGVMAVAVGHLVAVTVTEFRRRDESSAADTPEPTTADARPAVPVA